MIQTFLFLFMLKSKLALLTAQQTNESESWGIKTRNTTLFSKSTDWEDGRLMSQPSYLGLDARFLFMDQRWGSEVRPLILQISSRMASLLQGICLLLSCHLQVDRVLNKSTIVEQVRGRILWGRPLCMIIITKTTESKSNSLNMESELTSCDIIFF